MAGAGLMDSMVFLEFPLGQIVEAFRDTRYDWGLARISGHLTNSYSSVAIITVTFLEDSEIVNYNCEFAYQFIRHISKGEIVRRKWKVGSLVRVIKYGDSVWHTGKIVEVYSFEGPNVLSAVVVRIMDGRLTFMLEGFRDDGTHDRLRRIGS